MFDLASDLDYQWPEKKRPLVISHSPCADGFTAAWAAWLAMPDAEFVPGVYGQDPPDCAGRDVYLLDFSYKRPVMEKIVQQAASVTVLDHHKSAEADLKSMFVDGAGLRGVFDTEKSGARLAWEWFHPKDEVPFFVRLVEDRDLWRFAIPYSKEFNAAFFSYEYEFATWCHLNEIEDCGTLYNLYLNAGKAIERAQQKTVKELVGKLRHDRYFHKLDDGDGAVPAPCANLPYTLASDAANLMAEGAPFAATYYQDAEGQFVFSLRSKEAGADVSEVAKLYGGGGHKHAAGFRIAMLEDL